MRGSVSDVLFMLRYGIPGLLLIAGVILLLAADESVRYDGFGLSWGAAFALAVFAQLTRLNTSGADDRNREEAARNYYSRHGRWPDDD